MKQLFTFLLLSMLCTKNYRMVFDYRRFFMGSKFGIFNYATKKVGGYVDVDYFKYHCDE